MVQKMSTGSHHQEPLANSLYDQEQHKHFQQALKNEQQAEALANRASPQSTIMKNLVFSEMLNKQFMESASYHQQLIKEKINVQQIMRELNGGVKGLGAKEMSTDYFLDSLFKRKNNEQDKQEQAISEGEYNDTDQSDLEFRKQDEGDGEERFLREDEDTTDLEFDDHWGVERRGEMPLTSD